jgi:hypothetical protein
MSLIFQGRMRYSIVRARRYGIPSAGIREGGGFNLPRRRFSQSAGVHALTLEQYYDWWSDYHKQWHVRLLRAYHWIRCIPNRVTELLLGIGEGRLNGLRCRKLSIQLPVKQRYRTRDPKIKAN